MAEEDVLDAEAILSNDIANTAAVEILFTRYKNSLYGTDIGNAPEIWCSLNGTDVTPELISKIQTEVQHLYKNDNIRKKVFRAMHDHDAKSWR